MSLSTSQLRKAWHTYECAAGEMVEIAFGPDRISVAPPTVDAWAALSRVLAHHGYTIRTTDTDSYNCRTITGGTEKSLHAFGIALDINWTTNPYIDHPGTREVRFSDKPTQHGRALDVKQGLADTDMTPGMIADAVAIKTKDGNRVFEWGGHWNSVKDAMHFEIDLSPDDIGVGIDWTTVPDGEPVDTASATNAEAGSRRYRVTARSGLRMRAGPGTDFDVLAVLPLGTVVVGLGHDGDWLRVDQLGDGQADGHMHSSFLSAT